MKTEAEIMPPDDAFATLELLRGGRLKVYSFPDGRAEWLLDGQPLIESFPIEVRYRVQDGGIVISASRQWRRVARNKQDAQEAAQ